MNDDYRLTINGYRDAGEPEHQYFDSLPNAHERAWEMNLKHYTIWEQRDKRWVSVFSSSMG